MAGMGNVFVGVLMALGCVLALLGLALKVFDDVGWALVAAGGVAVVAGALVQNLADARSRA